MLPDGPVFVLRLERAAPFAAVLLEEGLGGGGPVRVEETTPPLLSLAARGLARAGSGARHVLPYEVRVGALATLRRGLSLLRPVVEVSDGAGAPLGRLRQRLWANAGGFDVLDAAGGRVGALRRQEGAFTIHDPAGRALATLTPASGPERRITLDPSLEGPRRLLMLAALASLDRVLEG